jgi:hypothetical protein
MMSFVREKKWTRDGLSVVRRGPDNAREVCAKWRDHKMSQFLSPEAGTSRRGNNGNESAAWRTDDALHVPKKHWVLMRGATNVRMQTS